MLLYQTNPVGVQLFSHVNTFFRSNKFTWLLDTRVNTLYNTCSYWAQFSFRRRSSETTKGKLFVTVEVTTTC